MTGVEDAELLIFDCDGVLVDTEAHLQAVDLRLIAELGWPITVDEIRTQHLGRSTADVVANIERHLGRRVPEDFATRRRQAYQTAVETGLSAIAEVEDALQHLLAAGYRMCVASSGSPEAIASSLSRTALAPYFGANTFSSYQVPNGKPAPDLFLHAAKVMKAIPARCIVIEDSPAGVTAARTAKMRVVGFAQTTPPRLLAHADLTIQHMRQLPDAIRDLCANGGIANRLT